MTTPSIPRQSSAVLMMDFQEGILQGHAPDRDTLVPRAGTLLATARAAGLPVIHVVVGFRPGHPEVSARNPSFSAIAQAGRFSTGDKLADIVADLTPQANEPVVTKHRVGAFTSTDLDMLLRAHGVSTLILAGVATSGVVLSTLRVAADTDYHIIVARDACSDSNAQVHEVLMDHVFPRQATVVDTQSIIAGIEAAA